MELTVGMDDGMDGRKWAIFVMERELDNGLDFELEFELEFEELMFDEMWV